MQKDEQTCGYPETTKTRITFLDLFGGGQKVITGFCSASCLQTSTREPTNTTKK